MREVRISCLIGGGIEGVVGGGIRGIGLRQMPVRHRERSILSSVWRIRSGRVEMIRVCGGRSLMVAIRCR